MSQPSANTEASLLQHWGQPPTGLLISTARSHRKHATDSTLERHGSEIDLAKFLGRWSHSYPWLARVCKTKRPQEHYPTFWCSSSRRIQSMEQKSGDIPQGWCLPRNCSVIWCHLVKQKASGFALVSLMSCSCALLIYFSPACWPWPLDSNGLSELQLQKRALTSLLC